MAATCWSTARKSSSWDQERWGKSSTSRMEGWPLSSHHEAVDADAEAARGWHAVLQGGEEVLVEAVEFLVAVAAAELLLLLEAAALLQGVVELGEGVGDLHAAQEGLEALDVRGVVRLGLGQGRHLHGVVDEEGGLHQRGLHPVGQELVDEASPANLLGDGDAQLTHAARQRRRVPKLGNVNAAVLEERGAEVDAGPRRLQVDGLALPGDRGRAEDILRDGGDHLLHHSHDVVVVGVGLVAFEERVLGVVVGVQALVAEDAADLKDTLQAADDAALEVELDGDAEVERAVQGAVGW